jgi:hypothetical protein
VEEKPVVQQVVETDEIPLAELRLEDTSLWQQPMDMEARAEFERFLHHTTRFLMYKTFAERDQKGRVNFQTDQWIARYREYTTPQNAMKLLTDVWAAIDLAREVIAWSYAFAYMVPPWFGTNLIALRQGALERATEALVNFMWIAWQRECFTKVTDHLAMIKKTTEDLLSAVEACREEQNMAAKSA